MGAGACRGQGASAACRAVTRYGSTRRVTEDRPNRRRTAAWVSTTSAASAGSWAHAGHAPAPLALFVLVTMVPAALCSPPPPLRWIAHDAKDAEFQKLNESCWALGSIDASTVDSPQVSLDEVSGRAGGGGGGSVHLPLHAP